MPADLPLRAIEFAVGSVVLFGLLGVMVRLQRFRRRYEYRGRRLVGPAALASGLDLIPYAGHILAVPVLWVGVKKVTRADYFEAFFTMAIAYALVCGGSYYLTGARLNDWQARFKGSQVYVNFIQPRIIERIKPPPARTNAPAPAITRPVAASTLPAGPTATNPPGPEPVASAPAAALPTNQPPGPAANPNAAAAATTPAPAPPPPPPAPPVKPAENMAKYFTVKGVTRNGANSAASIQAGTRVYSVFLEEATLMQTPSGPVSVRFAELGSNWVTLEINGVSTKYLIR